MKRLCLCGQSLNLLKNANEICDYSLICLLDILAQNTIHHTTNKSYSISLPAFDKY